MLEWLKEMRQLWRASREHYDKQPKVEREGNELEFLPAAVEILETPASPIGRTVSILITVLFTIAIVWAWFGKIDIESTAQGRVIPKGQVKAVQPLEMGKVEEILVVEGQHVSEGQPLVKLDPTESETDLQQVRLELLESRLNAFRLKLLLDYLAYEKVSQLDLKEHLRNEKPDILKDASDAQLDLQQRLMSRDLESFRFTSASVQARIIRQNATISATRAEIARLEVLKPLADEKEAAHSKLLDNGSVSQLEWMNAREQQVETAQNLMVQRHRLEEAEAELNSIRSEGAQQRKSFRSEKLRELNEHQTRSRSSLLALTKAEERQNNRFLKAPVTGTVHQMQVHTVGGVVQPAEPLMVIVPDDAPLEVEAFVLNKDVGFLRPGLTAEIKVESFPYTRYGLIRGEVRHISRDSIEQEGIGRVYPMRVTLSRTKMLVNDRWEYLQPGMSVTVEVKTGKRRLIEFFLAPFMKYQDEALKER